MTSSGQKYSLAVQQHNFTTTKAADNFQNQAKKLPCHVKTVNNDDTVTVTFDIVDTTFTLPDATYPQAYSKWSREPTQAGDKGYIVPNDVNLGGESGLGGNTANLFQRGNLATGVFHPISNTNFPKRDKDQFVQTGGPKGHKVQTQDGTTFHLLDEFNNIVHNAAQGMVHLSGNIFQNVLSGIPIPAGLKGIVQLAGNVLQGGGLPIPAGLNGILHIAEKGILHIADNALGSIIPANLQGIMHLATNAISHTSVNGIATISSLTNAVNLVSKQTLNIGGPSASYVSAYDLTKPPVPNTPTNVNVIGSINASINISAGGSINAGGGFGGTPGGGTFLPGSLGEIIFSNITAGLTATSATALNVTTITLTPGIWDVHGEVWFNTSAAASAIVAAINTVSVSFPGASSLATARSELIAAITAGINTLPLRTCRVNVTVNTVYYLVAQCNFSSGTCTVTGNIWAKRS